MQKQTKCVIFLIQFRLNSAEILFLKKTKDMGSFVNTRRCQTIAWYE